MMRDLRPLVDFGSSDSPIIIAGPCSLESRDQALATANRLASIGIKIFRGGVWKPRTKPGSFEGIGEEGLQWLKEIKQSTGMLVATEVANRHHLQLAVESGVDIVWIGARTTSDPFAVQEIADAISTTDSSKYAVLIKNPLNPDLELWAGAIHRIYNSGARRIGAIHRGFYSYGQQVYRNIPGWHVAIELRLRHPDLPIICDPSHMGGRRDLIPELSQHALNLGFNGLMIESHIAPDCALSDANQQLTPDELDAMLKQLVVRSSSVSSQPLEMFRSQIDSIDAELFDIIAKRMSISREIGKYKKEHNITVLQPERYNDIIASRLQSGRQLGMSEGFLKTILAAIHDESIRQQILL